MPLLVIVIVAGIIFYYKCRRKGAQGQRSIPPGNPAASTEPHGVLGGGGQLHTELGQQFETKMSLSGNDGATVHGLASLGHGARPEIDQENKI